MMRRFVGFRRAYILRLLAAALPIALLLLLVGCGVDTPQNTFAPEGDVADKQRDIFNLALWPAIAIFVIVEGLLVFAVIRFRQKRTDEGLPKQVHGNTKLEIAWTVAPAILLLVLAVPMVATIVDLGGDPSEDALQVRVIGHQWIWEFEYLEFEDADGDPLTTFTELHIPVEREVAAKVESADVIHSFWVPRLAGKIDAIPGRTNSFFFNANKPGTFSGQCAEFCGLGHADMRLTVVVHESEEAFRAWVDEQLAEGQAAESNSGAAELVREEE
jgi:cytochrome c oxidase subunit 2